MSTDECRVFVAVTALKQNRKAVTFISRQCFKLGLKKWLFDHASS